MRVWRFTQGTFFALHGGKAGCVGEHKAALVKAGDEVPELFPEARADGGGGRAVDLVVRHVLRELRHQLVAARLQQDHQVCQQPTPTPLVLLLSLSTWYHMLTRMEFMGIACRPA